MKAMNAPRNSSADPVGDQRDRKDPDANHGRIGIGIWQLSQDTREPAQNVTTRVGTPSRSGSCPTMM